MDHNIEQAENMKLLLCVFEHLSRLKINFHKSEFFCYREAKECEEQYAQLFGCDVCTHSFRYLGITMHYRKLRNSDWKGVEERFKCKLSSWKGKMIQLGAD